MNPGAKQFESLPRAERLPYLIMASLAGEAKKEVRLCQK
jgi:hypothetical protein